MFKSRKKVVQFFACQLSICTYIFNVERYFLVWWPEEDKASVLPEHDILDGDSAAVGKSCVVSIGKATYVGKVSAIGKFYI